MNLLPVLARAIIHDLLPHVMPTIDNIIRSSLPHEPLIFRIIAVLAAGDGRFVSG
jgi:hypothetical protein